MHFSLTRVFPRYIVFIVGAGLDALPVAAALLLVDENDPVLGPLVDRLSRAGGEARGVGTVVADARQVEEPRVVHRELGSRGVERVSNPPEPDGVILIDVGGSPLLVGHADPQTTRLYDRMEQKDEESRGEDFDLG